LIITKKGKTRAAGECNTRRKQWTFDAFQPHDLE
jgi:hypothetical protein